jgi:hypothetical protein
MCGFLCKLRAGMRVAIEGGMLWRGTVAVWFLHISETDCENWVTKFWACSHVQKNIIAVLAINVRS